MENPLLTYSHRPKPFSNEVELRLTGTELVAERGRSKQTYPLEKLELIRLTFAPRNLARLAFACEVRASDGNSVKFDTISWRSLIAIDRHDKDYRAFVRTLAERAGSANPKLRLEAGLSPLRYRVMQLLGGLIALALGGAAIRFLMIPNYLYTALAIGTGLYFALWLKDFLRRNRPEAIAPEHIPERVLPPVSGS